MSVNMLVIHIMLVNENTKQVCGLNTQYFINNLFCYEYAVLPLLKTVVINQSYRNSPLFWELCLFCAFVSTMKKVSLLIHMNGGSLAKQ